MKGNERKLKKKTPNIAHSGREFRRPEVLFWGKSHAPDSNFVVPTTYTPPHPGAWFFRWFPLISKVRLAQPPRPQPKGPRPDHGSSEYLEYWLFRSSQGYFAQNFQPSA